MKDSSRLSCEYLLLWAQLRATRQVIQLDSPLCQAPLFCDRLWLLVKKQAMRRAKQQSLPVIPSFELSSAFDALPVKALLQATRPG